MAIYVGLSFTTIHANGLIYTMISGFIPFPQPAAYAVEYLHTSVFPFGNQLKTGEVFNKAFITQNSENIASPKSRVYLLHIKVKREVIV